MKKLLFALLLVGSTSTYGWGLTLDLTTGFSDTINNAIFSYIPAQPAGSGYIDSFLVIQENDPGRTNEQGYNTSITPAHLLPFDTQPASEDLPITSLQVFNGYYQFLLDINEINSGSEGLLSLDGLKFYSTTVTAQNSTSTDANGNASGIIGTPLWDMGNNVVWLNGSRNPGSGIGDLLVQIPVAEFDFAAGDTHLILWSRFGVMGGGYGTSDGFEEWAQYNQAFTPIPEPGAMLLLGTGLAILAVYSRRRSTSRSKNRRV